MGRDDHCTELTREELYAQVWAEPMTSLAQRYGLSDRGLAKICTRMGIPVPGRGYWARVQSGQVPLQAKLPKIKARQKAVVNLNKRGHILEETKELQDVAGYIASEMHPENQIQAARSAGYYSLPAITGGCKIEEWCAWALVLDRAQFDDAHNPQDGYSHQTILHQQNRRSLSKFPCTHITNI